MQTNYEINKLEERNEILTEAISVLQAEKSTIEKRLLLKKMVEKMKWKT